MLKQKWWSRETAERSLIIKDTRRGSDDSQLGKNFSLNFTKNDFFYDARQPDLITLFYVRITSDSIKRYSLYINLFCEKKKPLL